MAEPMKQKVAKAGFTCKEVKGPRGYAGAPFFRTKQEDCYYLTPGEEAVCDSVKYPDNHAPLCYCECKYLRFILLYPF